MAPTEILCRQHLATIERLAAPAGIGIALLTGREKGRARSEVLARIASGDAAIVVGTHALFQDDVAFRDLGLAVIDEQHRFGVEQRIALSGKGNGVDVLVMTATPIPRTLLLTAYGDLDVSLLREKPAGRQPIATRTIPSGRLDEVIAAVRRALDGGAQDLLDLPAGRGIGSRRPRRGGRAPPRSSRSSSARASASSTAA